ncbi:MAG: TIM barrel protein [Reyranella sp.]|uniref:sugar phosphate isomerase/epimerase family protein n=1 Tax=Reyranella sp. TaxID=1929291 RepID=UPI001AD3AC89|nr:TIM barrel protein [Reyranella sp.]MBN9091112.1 TIM barrel protein [Reyranella sp.]
MKPRLALAVIGDEIGPSLSEMLTFCAENDVRRLDMRTVDGRNLLGMELDEVDAIGKQLKAAGIAVPTFVSPVLKWVAPGKAPAGSKVDFAFDPATCPRDDALAHAFDVAVVLGATRIRVFSFLRYPGFAPHDLDAEMGRLIDLAGRSEVTVEVENEPVCNLGSVPELAAYFAKQMEEALGEEPFRLFRPLVDISNSWSMGQPPSDADIATLGPLVDLIHIKDRDLEARRTVPVGDGQVPWAQELTRLLSHVEAPEVIASLETHCPQDGRNATAKSVAALRRIAGEIDVEIV